MSDLADSWSLLSSAVVTCGCLCGCRGYTESCSCSWTSAALYSAPYASDVAGGTWRINLTKRHQQCGDLPVRGFWHGPHCTLLLSVARVLVCLCDFPVLSDSTGHCATATAAIAAATCKLRRAAPRSPRLILCGRSGASLCDMMSPLIGLLRATVLSSRGKYTHFCRPPCRVAVGRSCCCGLGASCLVVAWAGAWSLGMVRSHQFHLFSSAAGLIVTSPHTALVRAVMRGLPRFVLSANSLGE